MQTVMTSDEYLKSLKGSKLEALFDALWDRWSVTYAEIEHPEHEVCLIPDSKVRCDRVWHKAKLIVEIDGGQWAPGGGRHNSDEDRDKINLLILNGWKVLRYSGTMLECDPHGVMLQVIGAVMGIKQPKYYKRLVLPKKKRASRKKVHP